MEKILIITTALLMGLYGFGYTVKKEIITDIEINAPADTVWSN